MRRWFMILFLLVVFLLQNSAGQDCRTCHQQTQSNCNLTCQDCHLSSRAEFKPNVKDHPRIIKNPSREQYWQEKCVSCHKTEIASFKNSLHYSSAGIIDQTRFLFGKNKTLLQTDAEAWKKLRDIRDVEQKKPGGVVDHLLASKCLACHFEADRRSDVAGRKHAVGCAGCHVQIDQQSGKPLHGHRFQKKVKDQVCLTCHSGNRVGADYYGYFEHDYHNQYNTPYGAKAQFGAFQHRLTADVHRQAGLQCVDCHREHVARKIRPQYEGQQPLVRCQDCHGGFNEKPANKINRAKRFKSTVIAHQNFHQRLRCSACHARWSYQDYGLHLFLDQSAHYEMWADYLWQGDGEVTQLLQQQLGLAPPERKPAYSLNKISGKKMNGVWYQAWTFRRWEDPVLGVDEQGKIGIIRPLYQYFITFVDSLEQVWIDSQKPVRADGQPGWNWAVYGPHTIGKSGRQCESCHLNGKAVGLGLRQSIEDEVVNKITLPQPPILPGQRLLNGKEKRKLLNKTVKYRQMRAKMLQKLFESK